MREVMTNDLLQIDNIRAALNRLEETIIFALIERAQFKLNEIIYKQGAFGADISADESLVGYLLHETERIHARMRRYTAPEEAPFHDDLPQPVLPTRSDPDSPIRPNSINVCHEIRRAYEKETVPVLCDPGDDGQYGSSSVCDVTCLQAIATRVHFAKFVAESKYRENPSTLDELIRTRDRDGLLSLITDTDVEQAVLDRVNSKARTYGQEPGTETARSRINAGIVTDLYRCWIIPLTKEVETRYLFERAVPPS